MARIFAVLAAVSTLLLLVTFWLGVRIGEIGEWNRANRQVLVLQEDLIERQRQLGSSHEVPSEFIALRRLYEPLIQRRNTHFLVAILSALVVLLVNSVSITYFIGTARWCKEVANTYNLGTQLVRRSLQLKRNAFRWALAAILLLFATVFLGGAADTDTSPHARWAILHYAAAMVMSGVVVWAFMAQAVSIHRNTQLIEQMLAEVQRIRQEKGLPVEG